MPQKRQNDIAVGEAKIPQQGLQLLFTRSLAHWLRRVPRHAKPLENKMTKFAQSLLVLTVLITVAVGTSAAYALPIGTNGSGASDITKKQRGGAACAEWCIMHNKTEGSINKCLAQCDKYWG